VEGAGGDGRLAACAQGPERGRVPGAVRDRGGLPQGAVRDALARLSCPACGHKGFCRLKTRELFQCNRCKRQVRLTAGTVFQDTKLPLTVWFQAIYHLTQSKNGISSIEFGRRLGVKRQTAWLMKHKLMRAMAAREAHNTGRWKSRRMLRPLSGDRTSAALLRQEF
jgi:transposase-like protein